MNFIQRGRSTTASQQRTFNKINLLILVWTLISMIVFSCVSGTGGSDFSCNKLKSYLENRKYLDNQFPRESFNDGHLRICTKDSETCCLEDTEKFLATESRMAYNKAVTNAISQLSSTLSNRSKRFDSFFKTLLSESKRDFDKMFKKTYGIIYEQNSFVFTDLFEKLETYYSNGQVDLEKAMDNFFNTLYQKMFTVLNAQYQFNDKYLVCIGHHMEELKPFGDVPQKLSVQIKRSFVATRTFAQALSLARDIVENMQNESSYSVSSSYVSITVKPGSNGSRITTAPFKYNPSNIAVGKEQKSNCVSLKSDENKSIGFENTDSEAKTKLGAAGDCHHAHTRMSQCQACKNMPDLKPCSNYCVNVLKGCLAYHLELDTEWNNFVDAMDKVSDRLLGPFNIEVVVEPINIKISEAIMNFQENALEVSEKVFSGCGRLHLGRRSRRETRELELETYQFTKEDTKQSPSEQQQPSLEKLIREIRQKVKDSKSFWSNLPYQICHEVATSKDTTCWNGTAYGRYTKKIAGGLNSQQMNPEVTVDMTRSKTILKEQIFNLKIVSGKLKNAYNGFDVEWIDIEDSSPIENGSGEGSGYDRLEPEGSGDGKRINHDYDDTEDGDDDDDDGGMYTPKKPVSSNDESNMIPKSADDLGGGSGTNVFPSSSSSDFRSQITLMKAVASYLFPICVVWLGGLLSDWL